MLRQFYMNGDLWRVHFVSPYDNVLIDRTGQKTLAVSDYSTMTISIANNLHGELLNLTHQSKCAAALVADIFLR